MINNLWVLHALLSHWRRHPLQLMTLVLGLLSATALWSGVQALNQQARHSYDQASSQLERLNQPYLVHQQQAWIPQAQYIELRRTGWPVTPMLQEQITLPEGQVITLIGLDPVTLQQSTQQQNTFTPAFSLSQFLSPPWEVWLSPTGALQLQPLWDNPPIQGFPRNPEGELPRLRVNDRLADNELITDLSLVQHWLKQPEQLSHLLLLDSHFNTPLPDSLQAELRRIEPESDQDIARLTDSFHLNLSALSLLAFLVGLMMVYSAVNLALTQRLVLKRILYACGVSQFQLLGWLMTELLLLSSLIAIPGLIAGYWIAALLLPDVSASLAGLYGADIPPQLQLPGGWWHSGLLMAVGGTLFTALVPLIKLLKQQPAVQLSNPGIPAILNITGMLCALAAICLALLGDSLLSGFMLLALIFISAGLLLPGLLNRLLQWGQHYSGSVTQLWFWADARLQIAPLSVALVALLFALSTSIGVGGMVEGFRLTFTGWLEQRLAAEVYLRAEDDEQAEQIHHWLTQRPEVTAILPSGRTDIQLNNQPIELRGIQPHATYSDHWPLLAATPNTWAQLDEQAAVLINEQLARQQGWQIGDWLHLPGSMQSSFYLAGIYSDYGNPKGQILMSLDTLEQNWPDTQRGSFALRVIPEAVDPLLHDLRLSFNLSGTRLLDQQAVKDYSLRLFERTFAATQALNLLVLSVAAVALFSSLLTLSSMRLTQVAPVWACGVSRRHLVGYELLRLLLLALLTALMAIPLGLLISYCLVTLINVRAFGWALPWQYFPLHWILMILAALGSALAAAALPLIQLARYSPTRLLQGFRDDH